MESRERVAKWLFNTFHHQRPLEPWYKERDDLKDGYRKRADELLALIQPEGEPVGRNPETWRPMSTAPRDGTKILAWSWEHKQARIMWWDTSYSIHGLGGCWVPGTYGDSHLSGWLPADAILGGRDE